MFVFRYFELTFFKWETSSFYTVIIQGEDCFEVLMYFVTLVASFCVFYYVFAWFLLCFLIKIWHSYHLARQSKDTTRVIASISRPETKVLPGIFIFSLFPPLIYEDFSGEKAASCFRYEYIYDCVFFICLLLKCLIGIGLLDKLWNHLDFSKSQRLICFFCRPLQRGEFSLHWAYTLLFTDLWFWITGKGKWYIGKVLIS